MVEVRQKAGNQPQISYFFDYCGRNIFEIKLKILNFQDRFDILLKMRLSGVAEQECTKLYGKSQITGVVLDGNTKNNRIYAH